MEVEGVPTTPDPTIVPPPDDPHLSGDDDGDDGGGVGGGDDSLKGWFTDHDEANSSLLEKVNERAETHAPQLNRGLADLHGVGIDLNDAAKEGKLGKLAKDHIGAFDALVKTLTMLVYVGGVVSTVGGIVAEGYGMVFSEVIPEKVFDAIHRPPLLHAVGKLQTQLYHNVNDHNLERYVGAMDTEAVKPREDDENGAVEARTRYVAEARWREYTIMNTAYSIGMFLGEADIIIEAFKDNERNKKRMSSAAWALSWVHDAILQFARRVSTRLGWRDKATSSVGDSLTTLRYGVANISLAFANSNVDVRWDPHTPSSFIRKRSNAHAVALPKCLRLFKHERTSIGNQMTEPNDSDPEEQAVGRSERVISYHTFVGKLDEKSDTYDAGFARWFDPVLADLNELSSPDGYRACGERLRHIQHAALKLLEDIGDLDFLIGTHCQRSAGSTHGTERCRYLPPAKEHVGWHEVSEEDKYCSQQDTYSFGCTEHG